MRHPTGTDLSSEDALFFDARLYPHRSLRPKGFLILMVGVSLVSFTAGFAFYRMGAWPIPGFFGLDVVLLYLAFRLNYRAGRLGESLQLGQDALVVRRFLPGGRVRTWRFEPYWLRVQMDDPPRWESQLTLTSHGKRLTVASYLTPRERLEVARGLREALRERDRALNPALP